VELALSILILLSLLLLFCLVNALKLEVMAFEKFSTRSVVLVLVSHLVIFCCCFPLVSCDEVLIAVVADVLLLMFPHGQIGGFFYMILVLENRSVCLQLLVLPPTKLFCIT
jgi:hypothetical protein